MISSPAQHQRAHDLVLGVREEQPEGAEDAGCGWDEHAAHPQRARDLDAGQRPVAPERTEREVARVAAAVRRDGLHRARHRRDGELQDAVRGLLDRQPEWRRHHAVERRSRPLRIERDRAAAELRDAEVPEHEQRVRERRLVSSDPVARRPRDRTRRFAGRR